MKILKRLKYILLFLILLTFTLTTSGCDLNVNDIINKTKETIHQHQFIIQEEKIASCMEEGYTLYECTDCGYSYKENETEALGHEFDFYLIDDATCTENGLKRSVCKRCEETYDEEVIPASGHKQGLREMVESTCTEHGKVTTYCMYCKMILYVEELALNPHTEGDAVIENPTCTEIGYSRTYCLECNSLLNETEIEPLGHKEADPLIVEPTCTIKGLMTYYCEVCDEVIRTREIDPKGHTEGEWILTQAPQCLVDGIEEEYCSVCREKINERAVPQTGHSLDTLVVNKATCTRDGSAYIYCETCGTKIEDVVLDKKGHTSEVIKGYNATCEKDGRSDGHICSVCGDILDGYKVLVALGHDYVITAKTTTYGHSCNEYDCSRCSLSYIADLNTDYTKLYGYNYLLNNYENGQNMANLYKTLYDAAYAFTYSDTNLTKSKDDETYQSVLKVVIDCEYDTCTNHTKYGLTLQQASSVWNTMVHENPQFMFMYNGYSYGTSTEGHGTLGLVPYKTTYFNLCISADYYDATYRKQAIDGMRECSKELSQLMVGVTNLGDRCKVIHDYIIDRIDYAYIEGTTNAQTAKWAHNLVGFAMDYGGVCETYAKTYLYFSYLFGINSIIVYGDNHAWNMTEYNNLWYGIDCTWDDKKENPTTYTYFGANATTMNKDGHHPYSSDFGISYQYPIPTIGTVAWRNTVWGVQLP